MTDSSTQVIGTAYVTTLQGMCKIAEVVASFIGVLLVGINSYGDSIRVFESAASLSIVFSVILLILYASAAVEKIPLPMNKIQFFWHIILSVYYIVAAALVFNYGGARVIAGGVISFIAIIAHLIDAYDNFTKSPLC